MIRTIRLLLGTVMAVLSWLAHPAVAATMSPDPPVVTYAYATHTYDAPSNELASDRGPPEQGIDATYDAVDLWSLATSARPAGATPPAVATYDHSVGSLQLRHSTGTIQEQTKGNDGALTSLDRSGVAAKYGDEVVEGLGDSRTYIDLTKGGSIRNVGTNATHTEFADNLIAGGWTSRTSKDGAVQIFQRDGAKYVLRERAGSYGGWTADFTPAGAQDLTLKIRLGYLP